MVSSLRQRMLGTAAGLLIDRLVGEPPAIVHPVARFGQGMAWLDQRWWRDDRGRGLAYAAVGLGAAGSVGVVLDRCLPPLAAVAAATATSVAGRALGDAATTVGAALERDDLTGARRALTALVARDPRGLEEKEIVRAVVESVAENSADAIVAPALWAAVAGAPGVLVHRAANTLDAMVGYRNERYGRFGWAAARADDVLAWPAARVTALLVALVRPARALDVWRTVRRDAPDHPSPNAGVTEAAFAAALGLRLGGTNRYGDQVEVRPNLGDGRPPEPKDIARVVRLSQDVTVALAMMLVTPSVGAWWIERRTRRMKRKP
jgi:adenosylcobinamide-phosphate synthase